MLLVSSAELAAGSCSSGFSDVVITGFHPSSVVVAPCRLTAVLGKPDWAFVLSRGPRSSSSSKSCHFAPVDEIIRHREKGGDHAHAKQRVECGHHPLSRHSTRLTDQRGRGYAVLDWSGRKLP